MNRESRARQIIGTALWILLYIIPIIALLTLALCMAGCHTVEAVYSTPDVVWEGLGRIVEAFWADILSLIDMIL